MIPPRLRLRLAILAALVLFFAGGLLLRKSIKRLFQAPDEISTGLFQDPEGLTIDEEGTLYVADEDRGVLTVIDPKGRVIATLKSIDGLEGSATSGDSLVAIAPGRLVMLGAGFNLVDVQVRNGKGTLIRSTGRKGTAPGDFGDPEGIARDSNGDLYVTDEDNRRVQVFDRDLKFLRAWPVDDDPESICISQGRVYVTFSKDDWIGVYDRLGALILRFGEGGSEPGRLRNPDCVLVSPDGGLYVTDQKNDRIQVFDLEGRFRFAIGGPGREPGRFRDPEDLAFDREGNLVVADGGNHRVQVLTPAGLPLRVIE